MAFGFHLVSDPSSVSMLLSYFSGIFRGRIHDVQPFVSSSFVFPSSVDWSLLSPASLSSPLIASLPVAVPGLPACAGSALVHSVPMSLSCSTMGSIVVAHLSGLASALLALWDATVSAFSSLLSLQLFLSLAGYPPWLSQIPLVSTDQGFLPMFCSKVASSSTLFPCTDIALLLHSGLSSPWSHASLPSRMDASSLASGFLQVSDPSSDHKMFHLFRGIFSGEE